MLFEKNAKMLDSIAASIYLLIQIYTIQINIANLL